MVWDSSRLYAGLVWWCDIHCMFLSTFRVCVLPGKSICIICLLHMVLSDMCQCVIIAFVSLFTDILSFILSLFHVQILPPLKSAYLFHCIPLPLCLFYLCEHWSALCEVYCTVLCTWCSHQWTVLCTWDSQSYWAGYIKARYMTQIRFDRATEGTQLEGNPLHSTEKHQGHDDVVLESPHFGWDL